MCNDLTIFMIVSKVNILFKNEFVNKPIFIAETREEERKMSVKIVNWLVSLTAIFSESREFNVHIGLSGKVKFLSETDRDLVSLSLCASLPKYGGVYTREERGSNRLSLISKCLNFPVFEMLSVFWPQLSSFHRSPSLMF